MKHTSIRFTDENFTGLEKYAEKNGISLNQAINLAVDLLLSGKIGSPGPGEPKLPAKPECPYSNFGGFKLEEGQVNVICLSKGKRKIRSYERCVKACLPFLVKKKAEGLTKNDAEELFQEGVITKAEGYRWSYVKCEKSPRLIAISHCLDHCGRSLICEDLAEHVQALIKNKVEPYKEGV